MEKTNGLTIISLLLVFLSIAGFGNAAVMLSGALEGFPIHTGILALAYGVLALASAIGLWKMKIWSIKALRGWMIVCLVFLTDFSIANFDFDVVGIVKIGVFSTIILVIFWRLNSYVSSKLNQPLNKQAQATASPPLELKR